MSVVRRNVVVLVCAVLSACGTALPKPDVEDASTQIEASTGPDRARIDPVPPDAMDPTRFDAMPTPPQGNDAGMHARSLIQHVVIISQENHTFDNYFGRYCTAPAGSNPSCNEGPACCEAVPDTEPSGSRWLDLDDTLNADRDPDHTQRCEAAEINGGRMDRFVTGTFCSDRRNFAVSPPSLVRPYHDWAAQFALADRYFQPIVGQTAANDMYFAAAKKMFLDNEVIPYAIGRGCNPVTPTRQFVGEQTIADVLLDAGVRVAFYAEGYRRMREAALCPSAPSDCRHGLPTYPCIYDPSDVPFNYYRQFADNPSFLKDWEEFYRDMDAGRMPEVVYIKSVGYHTEHPGYGTRISVGVAWVEAVVQRILASPYADRTLILLTWDEGGGYFDHISPPGVSPIDNEAPGTRVPMLAIGRFARHNYVSHVPMEHSSIVKFLEWNYTGRTGQLRARDTLVNNLGSLLDPMQTGVPVPEH